MFEINYSQLMQYEILEKLVTSIIVLLPKEGKDPSDIKNWRPLTLSNCDAKITEYPAFSPQLSTCLITSSVLELLGWFW